MNPLINHLSEVSWKITLTVIDNTIRMLTGSVNVYRYTAIRMYVINIKQERVVYILHWTFQGLFFVSLSF